MLFSACWQKSIAGMARSYRVVRWVCRSALGRDALPSVFEEHRGRGPLLQGVWWDGFYPEITDCLERAENFWSCLTRRRRILGLWRRSMYSNTSDRAASSVGYVVR